MLPRYRNYLNYLYGRSRNSKCEIGFLPDTTTVDLLLSFAAIFHVAAHRIGQKCSEALYNACGLFLAGCRRCPRERHTCEGCRGVRGHREDAEELHRRQAAQGFQDHPFAHQLGTGGVRLSSVLHPSFPPTSSAVCVVCAVCAVGLVVIEGDL